MSISPFGRKGVTSATVEPCLSGTISLTLEALIREVDSEICVLPAF